MNPRALEKRAERMGATNEKPYTPRRFRLVANLTLQEVVNPELTIFRQSSSRRVSQASYAPVLGTFGTIGVEFVGLARKSL